MNAFTPRPHYCNDVAFSRFAEQVANLDAGGALLRAAVAISIHDAEEMQDTDHGSVEIAVEFAVEFAVEKQLQDLADRILARVHSDDERALLAHAHAVLFDEENFIGNVENFFDPHNSYIPDVLQTRRGIPITLTLIYKEVLERLGLTVAGINSPGHFLASVWIDGRPMLVDTFTRGRVLTRDEAYDRIGALIGDVDRDRDLLPPATNAAWLARLLQNLIVVFGQSRQRSALAAMLELQSLLAHSQGRT